MDSIELARLTHEELELLEQASVEQLMNKPKMHKERLIVEQRVASFLDQIAEKSQYLLDLYKDDDRSRQNEIQALTCNDDLSEFYDRLKKIKDHHRRIPNEVTIPLSVSSFLKDPNVELEELETMFRGDEGLGKYLDLHSVFNQFLNLKHIKKVNYLLYLSDFDNFRAIPLATKMTNEYLEYLESFQKYLESFFQRSKPLLDYQELCRIELAKFDSMWKNGEISGWSLANETDQVKENSAQLSSLHCLACDKMFSKQSVFEGHKKGKRHIKAAAELAAKGIHENEHDSLAQAKLLKEEKHFEQMKPIAQGEMVIIAYIKQLTTEREDTKAHIERKQALTDKERMEDALETFVDINEFAEDEEEEKIYNPLKLPMGWDGKPIPYWLYKLHGLGIEYPCEICGNFVYMGRKAFDRHFQEWRHAHGMRCLGIPNSKQFHDVTSINDAYALAEKLKSIVKRATISADAAEEFEDDAGNVYSKKTYEDLKRQGLL
ncbi:Pre-mRNA-splicing factor sap61 [Batrachochytrium dendrobatidis]|nr:Pre-mRNA-splicing factor sap61 [Batrachochytrium dendrobatidis]KAK5664595.1 Pre-mRNA-splicing factor sap61 [Batrachochytrium dendrobatidis]